MSQITIVGNLTADPELRYTASGKAVASFTVVESSRVKDGDGWKDGPTTYWRCSLWDSAAENLTESLTKGVRVIVTGEAKQRSWETSSGEKRSAIEVTVTEVGPSLRWATTKVDKTGKSKLKPKDDPWASAPADDEAPF
jgi:single-strand DNA-binding protein